MSNLEVTKLFRNIAAAYAIKNETKYRFQIIAYSRAADAIESLTTEVKDLYYQDKLQTVPGIGPSMRSHIEELVKTGEVKHFNTILRGIPKAMFPLLDIPSFGPKKAYKLVTHFGFTKPETVVSELEKVGKEGKIAKLDGFGEKSQEEILKAIDAFKLGRTKNVRMPLPFANELAEGMLTYLKQSKAVINAYPLGSLRRRQSTIGDVDIAVATHDPNTAIDHFVAYPFKERVIEQGPTSAGIEVAGGRHIDLMTQPSERFGALLQHFTGSKNHNIHLREYALKKGLSLSERGIKKTHNGESVIKEFATEEAFYEALGLQWIPPEMREDTGEIELGIAHKIPALVELKDIRGDFHLHSSFPIEPSHDMGKDTMEDMVKKAISLGYAYLGFSEHNPSFSKHTPEQTYKILLQRSKEIERLNKMYNKSIHIFSLLETDIFIDGKLAIDDKSLDLLDGTLVSIHSSFGMDKKAMTERVLKGLSHPKAKILSHPTGRLINQRIGYDLDWEQVFAFCLQHNKALEINSWPSRLDLPDVLVREAIEKGVKLIINTDSHAGDQMDLMQYGVSVARRGWAKKSDILNTLDYNEMKTWIHS